MRTGLALVVLGVLWVVACSSTDVPDEDCIVNGGVCFTKLDEKGCFRSLEFACAAGYQCCEYAFAGNLSDGHLVDASTGQPDGVGEDAPPRVDTGTDAPPDTSGDAVATDATATKDATESADAKKD